MATKGTIFNWDDIVSNSLSSCMSATLVGLTHKKSEFYMSSFMIDIILCTHQFPALNCKWDKTKTPVYSTYQIFWAHKYYSFYKSICEDFLISLYKIIFLIEYNFMSERELEMVRENGHYYLS